MVCHRGFENAKLGFMQKQGACFCGSFIRRWRGVKEAASFKKALTAPQTPGGGWWGGWEGWRWIFFQAQSGRWVFEGFASFKKAVTAPQNSCFSSGGWGGGWKSFFEKQFSDFDLGLQSVLTFLSCHAYPPNWAAQNHIHIKMFQRIDKFCWN